MLLEPLEPLCGPSRARYGKRTDFGQILVNIWWPIWAEFPQISIKYISELRQYFLNPWKVCICTYFSLQRFLELFNDSRTSKNPLTCLPVSQESLISEFEKISVRGGPTPCGVVKKIQIFFLAHTIRKVDCDRFTAPSEHTARGGPL